MLIPLINQLRDPDSRFWPTATWAVPFMFQLVLGAMLLALWLLGKVPYFTAHNADTGGRAWLLTAASVAALIWVPVSGLLIRSRSSRIRGIGMSVAGSVVIVLIGTVVFAFWILRW
jgi:hypothetical protein